MTEAQGRCECRIKRDFQTFELSIVRCAWCKGLEAKVASLEVQVGSLRMEVVHKVNHLDSTEKRLAESQAEVERLESYYASAMEAANRNSEQLGASQSTLTAYRRMCEELADALAAAGCDPELICCFCTKEQLATVGHVGECVEAQAVLARYKQLNGEQRAQTKL